MNDQPSKYRDPNLIHQEFFQRLFATPIDFEKIGRFRTPLDYYQGLPKPFRSHTTRVPRPLNKSGVRGDFVAILRRGLGHLAANPSIPANREALRACYTFPTFVDPEHFAHLGIGGDLSVLNENPETAKEFFVTTLGQAAFSAAEIFRDKLSGSEDIDSSTDAIFRSDRHLIIGERGVGKTFFLNYLLSNFTADLHQNRTIVVRLDLTKDVHPDLSIIDWLHWKICKILFAYYDSNTFERDVAHNTKDLAFRHYAEKEQLGMLFDLRSTSDELFNYASSIDTELSRQEFSTVFREQATQFRSPSSLMPKKIGPSWFFPMLWDYVVGRKKCNFVIIFDGLDQLGLTEQDESRYEKLVSGVSDYLATEKRIWAATVVTMRPKTFRDQIGDNNFRNNFKYSVIAQADSSHIYTQRQKYIRQAQHFSHKHPTVGKLGRRYSKTIDDFTTSYIKFVAQSLARSVRSDLPVNQFTDDQLVDVGFDILRGIFGDNRRKVFQALADVAAFYLEFLPDKFEAAIEDASNIESYFEHVEPQISIEVNDPYREISRYHYLLVEALMLENPREGFRREKYQYRFEEDGAIRALAMSGNSPSHYIHNVFHHASNAATTQRCHLLLGLRMLQATLHIGAFNRKKLFSFLGSTLSYDHSIVRQKFNEMVEDGLFEADMSTRDVVTNSYRVTKAGAYMLSGLIPSIEYLSIALQTSPLPRSLVENNLFPVRHHLSPEFAIQNKLFSCVNFCRLLAAIESSEQSMLDAVRRGAPDEKVDSGMLLALHESFSMAESISNKVKAAVARIISHAHSSGLRLQIADLDQLMSSN